MNQTASHSSSTRIRSVDLLRGAIMVLMAIDHVRVYAGVPPGGQDPAVFFTRWVTHFCAPGFVFFAGVSAYLYGQRLTSKSVLIRFLLTRGIFLIFLELTFIRFFWTFNFDYVRFTLAGVIWMIGWCMILMTIFVRFKPLTAVITGLLIITFQQVFSLLPRIIPQNLHRELGWFWEFIYPSSLQGVPGITILYVLVPWIGVMLAGYGFGGVWQKEESIRRRICLWVGISSIVLFVIIGSLLILSQVSKPSDPPFIFGLLNQNKYPASQLFLLMTLGPLIALILWAEKVRGWLAEALSVFGRVPMFYYLLHIPFIHISALLTNLLVFGKTNAELYATAPYTFVAPELRWSIGLLYLVFIINVLILYFVCKQYDKYTSAHKDLKWLRFL